MFIRGHFDPKIWGLTLTKIEFKAPNLNDSLPSMFQPLFHEKCTFAEIFEAENE